MWASASAWQGSLWVRIQISDAPQKAYWLQYCHHTEYDHVKKSKKGGTVTFKRKEMN